MNKQNPDSPKMFSQAWYNEYFQRAVSSPAHSKFCERVYGKDLCQHGMMDVQELDFLTTLIDPGSNILEIGCSNGFITEYVHDHTSATLLGIDFSDVAIEQARKRTGRKSGTLRFDCIDLREEELPEGEYQIILLIDSLYFLGDVKGTLIKLNDKLSKDGRMILTIFQYKDEEDDPKILLPKHTFLAQALNNLDFDYQWFDFSANAKAHGIKNYKVADELKDDFLREGNSFLYEARVAENVFFREAAETGALTRFMYVVEKKDNTI